MINPAGISGEASSGEKKFCVQTEFAPRPKPRITTSVSLNGEVVRKVENVWDKLPQTEEDKDEIERFLKKQHRKIIKDIKEKGEKFVLSEDEAQKIASYQVISKVKEVISGVEGVAGGVFFSRDNQIIGQDVLNAIDQTMVDLAQCSKDLASSLSSVSKVGNFIGGVLESKEMRMVFIPIKSNFLSVKVNPDVDIKELVQKIRAAIHFVVA